MHAGGISDEAVAECFSLQLIDYVSAKLGTNNAYARDMSRQAWNVLYPTIPPQYRTADCYNGGTYDLYPTSNVWP